MGWIDLLPRTKRAIIEALRHGDMDADSISKGLGLSINAVRDHLSWLEGAGLVEHSYLRRGPGRPKRVFRLSGLGMELFERGYDTMLDLLLSRLLDLYGAEHLRNLMRYIAGDMVKPSYSPRLEEALGDLISRLNGLGFDASMEANGDLVIVKSGNCPFYRVALKHPEMVCDALHTYMIEGFLGMGAELIECMARGSRVCRHSIVVKG